VGPFLKMTIYETWEEGIEETIGGLLRSLNLNSENNEHSADSHETRGICYDSRIIMAISGFPRPGSSALLPQKGSYNPSDNDIIWNRWFG